MITWKTRDKATDVHEAMEALADLFSSKEGTYEFDDETFEVAALFASRMGIPFSADLQKLISSKLAEGLVGEYWESSSAYC